MAHAATHTLVGFEADAPAKPAKAGKNVFQRIGDAFMESRQRAAEREFARHRDLIARIEQAQNETGDLPFSHS